MKTFYSYAEDGTFLNTIELDQVTPPVGFTDVEPPRSTGYVYKNGVWVLSAVNEDPRKWQIYLGPFKDRFGMDALAIYASSHDACKGVVGLLEGRLYIDLKDSRNAAMLDLLIAAQQPEANPIFPGSGPMTLEKKEAILNTPTTEEERFVKGLE